MQFLRWLAISAATFSPLAASAGGGGLAADADRVPWARFSGRIAYATATPLVRGTTSSFDGTGLQVKGLSVLGDVYFGGAPTAAATSTGGFRATSGVIVGARNPLWASQTLASTSGLAGTDRRLFGPSAALPGYSAEYGESSGTVPYIGIGYSRLPLRSGWSFSADLGLVSLSPGNAVRLGRVFGGGQSLDDIVRDMRLTPVLQLGASYSF